MKYAQKTNLYILKNYVITINLAQKRIVFKANLITGYKHSKIFLNYHGNRRL